MLKEDGCRLKDMLKGQVALVTGGTSGMGEAVARLYASEGAAVILCGLGDAQGKAIAEDITASGGLARFYGEMNVTDPDSIKATVDATIKEFNQIDILATFAGKTFDGDDLSAKENYDLTIDLNMTGTYNTVFAVLPHMKARKSGKIVICSSNGAFNPPVTAYVYHMAKAACESLTVNLAMELAPLGIRVNCIKPGAVKTPFWDGLKSQVPDIDAVLRDVAAHEIPMGRVGTPEDIAGPALFLASELSSYITGLCMYVAGGMGYVYSHPQTFLMRTMPESAGGTASS